MAAVAACLKWVDVLETQFDKSWVDLDLLFNQIDEDEEEIVTTGCRKHAASLASCFSQLAHKATVVFQNNAKLEAELVHLREETSHYKQDLDKISIDKGYLISVVQTTLIENHKLKYNPVKDVDVSTVKDDAPQTPSKDRGDIKEIGIPGLNDCDISESCVIGNPSKQSLVEPKDYLSDKLKSENTQLRKEILDLESELIGARLDNVYLDKELAGRIQQIQLLASNTPPEVKERLWTQIEAEMCLQRAKTIAQICQSKQELKNMNAAVLSQGDIKEEQADQNQIEYQHNGGRGEEASRSPSRGGSEERAHSRGKQVMVLKNPADDLGMAIIGGSEHNLPIIVSEIFPDSAVNRSSKLKAGDVILSVNGENFSNISHQNAVTFLSSLRGQITFELQAAETVSEDDPSNLDFRFYRIFDSAEKRGENIAAGKEKKPAKESNSMQVHPGRAVSSVELDRLTSSTPCPTVFPAAALSTGQASSTSTPAVLPAAVQPSSRANNCITDTDCPTPVHQSPRRDLPEKQPKCQTSVELPLSPLRQPRQTKSPPVTKPHQDPLEAYQKLGGNGVLHV